MPGETGRPRNLILLRSHRGYAPHLVSLACQRLAVARQATGMSHAHFATSLQPLLGWVPSVEVVKSWETTVAPPGDVVIACEMVASQVGPTHGLSADAASCGDDHPASRGTGHFHDEDGDDVHRRSLLLGSAFAAAAVVAPELLRGEQDGLNQIGMAEVRAVQQMALTFRNMDRRLGGGRVQPVIEEYLTTTVHDLLRAGCATERTRSMLWLAAADLIRLVGWIAFDAGDRRADNYFTQAVSLSEMAGNKAFSADVLVTMGNQLIHMGSSKKDSGTARLYGRQVVELADAGLAATKRCGSPSSFAILQVLKARGHGLLGEEAGVAQSLIAAERALERANPGDEPAWIHGFGGAQFASDAMRCYRDLGRPREAMTFFDQAAAAPDGQPRSQCLTQLTLASIRTQQREIEEACRAGHQALKLAGSVWSLRVNDGIRSLVRELAPLDRQRPVRELRSAASRVLALRP